MRNKKIQIQLSDHFNYRKLISFTLPSIIMMIFTSIYSVVDGFFVSNFAGKTPFTAINLIMPFLMILGAIGFMLGTGGSAIIAKNIGEGKREQACRSFSIFIYISIFIGIIIAILGIIFLRPVASALGAKDELLENCVRYGKIILIALPAFILEYEFQSFFVAAEKPKLGLWVTIAAGVTNIILDALLTGWLSLGLEGAAIATAISQCVGGIIPVIYFARPNSSLLKLKKTKLNGKVILKACTNGSSELLSNISMSFISMLYNFQLIKYSGTDGVAAYGVLMYVNMIFLAAFIGYSVGTAPIISYNYGSENFDELKSLLKKSTIIISIFAIFMLIASELLARPLAQIFVGYDKQLMDMTLRGFLFYSFSFLFAGFAIFGSSFFTALNNGIISALISFLRTLIFQVAAVLILPLIIGIDGIWISTAIAECLAVIVTIICIFVKRKKYHYL